MIQTNSNDELQYSKLYMHNFVVKLPSELNDNLNVDSFGYF